MYEGINQLVKLVFFQEVEIMTAAEYFNTNVIWAVEVDTGCGRFWKTCEGTAMLDALMKGDLYADSISDYDFAAKQENDFCRIVLNTADKNFRENRSWCKKWHLTSLFAVVDFILENNLVKMSETKQHILNWMM